MSKILSTEQGIALFNSLVALAGEGDIVLEGLHPSGPEEWEYEGLALGLLRGEFARLGMHEAPSLVRCEDSVLAHELDKLVCVVGAACPRRGRAQFHKESLEDSARRGVLEIASLRQAIAEGRLFESLSGKEVSACRKALSPYPRGQHAALSVLFRRMGLQLLYEQLGYFGAQFPEVVEGIREALEADRQARKIAWQKRGHL